MKSIKELTSNPNFIPDIYNYCDHWCERCAFTSKCANYAVGKDRFGDMKKTDINNAEFWESLSGILAETMKMLIENAKEIGIDLDNLEELDYIWSFEDTENHFLVQLCKKYESMVKDWLDKPNYFDKETVKLIESKQVEFKDAVEVILWYQYQIEVKFRRALDTLADDDANFVFLEMNSSAKVSLIGIDRSLAAWNLMLNLMKDRTKSILEIIVHLKKIQAIGEKQFPDARNFIRPGLDE